MQIRSHTIHATTIAEIHSDEIIVRTAEDGLNLLGDLYYQGFEKVILHQHQLDPAFFDLKSGLAGEILQKFANYRMRLAIVGDFEQVESKSLRDFIYESNQGQLINFVGSVEEGIG